MRHFFIGIDGGGTKCLARLEDETGHLLGQTVTGPANIRLSVDETWYSIDSAIHSLLTPLSLSLHSRDTHFHVGMGLAGCEVEEAYQAFIKRPHAFQSLVVSSDAHIACLGAHQGQDGAIIIVGTGVVGYQIEKRHVSKVSGWGFPHDDEGGGAWLGLQAMSMTLKYLDQRAKASALAKAVYAHFQENQNDLVTFANQANSTAFATLAPLVMECAKQGDPISIQLLQQAAKAIDAVSDALIKQQVNQSKPLPCALIGSVATFLIPYLGTSLTTRLHPCLATPQEGAILLVKNDLMDKRNIS